jgi:ABC-type microcin C transport system duplicated ATPase subunit YejF
MRHGEAVEEGPAGDVLAEPKHVYTQSLVEAAGIGSEDAG